MKQMKQACLKVAKDLLQANNTVTTLEVKTELRRDYPYYYWDQSTVSNYMAQFAGDGILTYTDNGTYRVYSLATPAQVAATAGPVSKALSKTKKSKKIGVSDILNFATDPNFDGVTITRKGKPVFYTVADIRAQKKSPKAYISRALNSSTSDVISVIVNGKVYQAV